MDASWSQPGAAIPDPALVVLVGPAGSGKSAWAAARYAPREVVSSDQLRAIVGSGEHDLGACGRLERQADQAFRDLGDLDRLLLMLLIGFTRRRSCSFKDLGR